MRSANQQTNEAGHVPASSLPAGKLSHHLALSQYLVLVFIMLGASVGDALLSRGMKQVGPVSFSHMGLLLHALLNPWVMAGIAVLISFMGSYMTALSWADLTFVQPATAFGNVVTALIGRLWLHEAISPVRWMGIGLIVLGVGFLAGSPARTEREIADTLPSKRGRMFDGRPIWGLQPVEWCCLLVYAVVVAWTIGHHESWADEAQAWLIARDSSLLDIFLKRLHYEGTPGLWHLLLWCEVRLGLTYAGMHWVSGLFGVGGVYLLLRQRQLPRALRYSLPFTAPVLYQLPIVARNYVFTLCVVLALCSLRWRRKPVLYVCVVAILANTSLFGSILAVGYVIEYFLPGARTEGLFNRARLLQCAAILLAAFTFAFYTALPATDIYLSEAGARLARYPALFRLQGQLTSSPTALVAAEGAPSATNATENTAASGDEVPAPTAPVTTAGTAGAQRLVRRGAHILNPSLYFVSPSNLLGLSFYLLLLLWLRRHQALRFALPFLLLALLGSNLPVAAHHSGVWWSALIGLLCLAWPQAARVKRHLVDSAFAVVLALIVAQQIAFGAHAAYVDTTQAFDGGEATALYLKSAALSRPPWTVSVFTTSIQPYFAQNIAGNQRTAYFPASALQVRTPLNGIVAAQPVVIVGDVFRGSAVLENQLRPTVPIFSHSIGADSAAILLGLGYRQSHQFCGVQPFNLGYAEKVCQTVYEPAVGAK